MNRDSHWERPSGKRQLKSIVGELPSKYHHYSPKTNQKLALIQNEIRKIFKCSLLFDAITSYFKAQNFLVL